MNKITVAQQAHKVSFLTPAQGLLQHKCAWGNHTVAGGECAACAKNKSVLQPKLGVGASNDLLEQEADRVADQVLAAPFNSAVSGAPLRIQRFSGQSNVQTDTASASVDRVLSSSGRPLEPTLQQDMEHRFRHDFSRVRVHSGVEPEQSALEVNANAYTVGHNIVFGARRFAPGTLEGRRLIAHELAHVVQQSGADGIRACQKTEIRYLAPNSPAIDGMATQQAPDWNPPGVSSAAGYIPFPSTPAASGTCKVGHSMSNCFPDAGGYIVGAIDNDCCTRPCTVEHEVKHVRDLGDCCKAYSQALKKPGANVTTLTQAWSIWRESARPITECRAYMNDISCAQRLAITKGCVPETGRKGDVIASNAKTPVVAQEEPSVGTAQANTNVRKELLSGGKIPPKGVREATACCTDIDWYEQVFANEAAQWCGMANGRDIPPCPFTAKAKSP